MVRHPVFVVLIEHPEGRVLIDTGYSTDYVLSSMPFLEPRDHEGTPFVEALARAGTDMGSIDYVIHTHLHFDHVGHDHLLDGATVFAHRDELRHAHFPDTFEAPAYEDRSFENPKVRLEVLEGDVEVLPGIELLETPGHSAGHYSVLLRGQDGGTSMLLTGDAAYGVRNLEELIAPGPHVDAMACIKSIHRLRHLVKTTRANVIYPHDPVAFASYRLAPDVYEV